jgi:phage-related tail fiber protein
MPIFRGKNLVSAVSDYKDSVRVATRTNLNIASNILTIDGVSLNDKDRILLIGQANQSQNGIYSWSTATKKISRAVDADSIFELSPGNKVYVEEGNSLGKTSWTLITRGVITPGITALVFSKESRINDSNVSGTYGGSGKTVVMTLDETGEINSISEVDIDIDGGQF